MFDAQISGSLRSLPFGYGRGEWDGDRREGWGKLSSALIAERVVMRPLPTDDRAYGPSEERLPGSRIY
jgi:hypothetical protein